MILFDIGLLPKGFDVNVWYQLYEKGLCFYDSKLSGNAPLQIETDQISLIDVSNMSSQEILKISDKINEINQDTDIHNKQILDISIENNKKLINYLKTINDGN